MSLKYYFVLLYIDLTFINYSHPSFLWPRAEITILNTHQNNKFPKTHYYHHKLYVTKLLKVSQITNLCEWQVQKTSYMFYSKNIHMVYMLEAILTKSGLYQVSLARPAISKKSTFCQHCLVVSIAFLYRWTCPIFSI